MLVLFVFVVGVVCLLLLSAHGVSIVDYVCRCCCVFLFVCLCLPLFVVPCVCLVLCVC